MPVMLCPSLLKWDFFAATSYRSVCLKLEHTQGYRQLFGHPLNLRNCTMDAHALGYLACG